MRINIKRGGLNGLGVFLSVYVLIAIFGPMICGDSGIAIVPYDYNSIDLDNKRVGPFDVQNVKSLYYRHWLGTDSIGRDVLAGLINGTRISFWVGLCSMLLALGLGLLGGFISGSLGDKSVKFSWLQLLLIFVSIIMALFYWTYSAGLMALLMTVILISFNVIIGYVLPRRFKKFYLPLDFLTLKFIELFKSIPALFLVLFLLTLFQKPSYWNVILIIGISSWTVITRFIRADMLRIKNENYYKAANAIGANKLSLFLKHGLPNAIDPVLVALAFGFGATILIEASLSFLNIGIPTEQVSWGSMLSEARNNFSMWWMAIFPGLMIFICIISFNKLGDQFNQKHQLMDDY